jgi:glycerol-3-phosphate acyltransferase PlsY
MAPWQLLLVLLPFSYVLGSVPFGLLVGWMRGVDIRKAGSGNIGATNVGRLLGKQYFFIVFALDLLKSLLPTLLASWIVRGIEPEARTAGVYALWIGVGLASVLGHMFSVFLRFRGGKGVASSAGFLMGVYPYYTLPGLGTVAVFLIAFGLTRYISVGSLSAAVAFPLLYVGMAYGGGWDPAGQQLPLLLVAVLVGGLVIWKHRGNLARLRAGTEQRM